MKGDNRCSYKQSTPHSTGLSMYLGSWLCLFNSAQHSTALPQCLSPESLSPSHTTPPSNPFKKPPQLSVTLPFSIHFIALLLFSLGILWGRKRHWLKQNGSLRKKKKKEREREEKKLMTSRKAVFPKRYAWEASINYIINKQTHKQTNGHSSFLPSLSIFFFFSVSDDTYYCPDDGAWIDMHTAKQAILLCMSINPLLSAVFLPIHPH